MISLTLVSRTVYPVVPSKTEYALTPLGQTFLPVLHAMCAWGQAYLDRADVDCSAE
ncbi:MAG: helix-turn-helix domain-containing protein [Gordonibacter sp.]